MKDKPTLEDLFNSKKLDLPDENFWNGFQDRVKGQAIASISHRTRTARLRKAGTYSVLPVLILSLIGWNLLNSEVSVSSVQAVALSNAEAVLTTDSLAQLESLMLQEDSLNREGAVQLARLDSFDSFTNAQVKLSGGASSFNHYSLSLSQGSGVSSQYTF
jgi:hypothetical protein